MNAGPKTAPTESHPISRALESRPVKKGEWDQTRVGDYQLERRLGSGAMGEVWLARHVVTRGRAALKMIHPDAAAAGHVQRFFARERKAVAKLSHPHIVQLHAVTPEYIVTAYVDGSDLARRLRTTIDPATAVRLTLQIASALSHAHANGVIHRDVKPSNVLIDSRGNAYLTDFGLAALLDEEEGGSQERAGTPSFMAPEQARGAAGPASDQYALGRTLLEMLAGGAVHEDSRVAVEQLPASLPKALKDAILRATLRDPERRWPSVRAFADALAGVDLRAYPPPVRLAPEVRVRGGFEWCTGASSTAAVTHEIQRAKFSLEELAKAGVLSPHAIDKFREVSGYAEVTWSLYGNRQRIGEITSTAALARAGDLVVLLHGMFCKGDDWEPLCAAICRDNAQAVVLAPDLFGCGGSRYDVENVTSKHISGEGIARGILAWLDLLGVRDLPTVLVGHSGTGAALLCVGDEHYGERISRVAVTPYFIGPSAAYRLFMRTYAVAVGGMARVPGLMKVLAQGFRTLPDFAGIAPNARESIVQAFERTDPRVLTLMLAAYAESRPAKVGPMERVLVLVGDDDPVARAEVVITELRRAGFPLELIEYLAGAQHMPHVEHRDGPEVTARNIGEIAKHVDSMLTSSREGTPLSTTFESTVFETSSGGGPISAPTSGQRAVITDTDPAVSR